MDVREKLVELQLKADIEDETSENTTQHREYTADLMIANGVTVQQWISVKDRLPEYDQVVLCYKDDRGVRTGKHLAATYADGVSAFKDCCRDYAFGATHWMPLPKPPKGE